MSAACEHGVDYADFCEPCCHVPAEEWVGYPMTICAFCIRPWPCDYVRSTEEREEPNDG